ncbi:hypothetical protein Tco_0682702 [Tanacetum coccineum]|uniref:Uncharacterized protein n=1 Tax=Tanacetum coccineum TaxID=301880 RepID=A0ABQ4XT08_9ASTR
MVAGDGKVAEPRRVMRLWKVVVVRGVEMMWCGSCDDDGLGGVVMIVTWWLVAGSWPHMVERRRIMEEREERARYFNIPPRAVSLDPVVVTAPRAVDPVGSPSPTTIDQDVPSASTSPTNQEIQSLVIHRRTNS